MKVRRTPSHRRHRTGRRPLAGGAVAVLAVVAGLVPVAIATQQAANGAVTTPSAGTVVRDAGPVTITEAVGGRYVGATTTAANTASALCNGSTVNRSPQASTRIRVIRTSDNVTVHDVTKSTPNALSAATANASAPFTTSWDTTGAQPGSYRILSTGVNSSRANIFAGCAGAAVVFSDHTVEYRPWQATFTDILGTGRVSLNTAPKEAQWKVKASSSPVVAFPAGTNNMQLFSAPDATALELADDPEACLADPAGCLPATAVQCDGPCDARFVIIGYADGLGNDSLTGVFDLDTGAFVALARAGKVTRVLLSLGPDLDQKVLDFFGDLLGAASSTTGTDLLSLMSTKVRVRMYNAGEAKGTDVEVSLAELITMAPAGAGGGSGVNLLAPFSLGVGQILHTYLYSVTANQCSSTDPHDGYTVSESQLAPSLPPLAVPAPPPLLVVEPGGTLKHVEGDYLPGSGSHSAGSSLIGPEIDTAPNAPSGLPAWLPLVDTGSVADSDIDFVGHAIVVTVPEVLIPPIPFLLPDGLCFGLGTLIGSGVALFGANPFPAGFGALPLLWDEQNPEVAALIATINGLSASSLANPAVQATLGAVLAGLAGAPTP